MAKFLANEVRNSDNFIHTFECESDNELATSIAMFMKSNGYTLLEGNVMNATYEKGNRTMRLLFGAFVKYYKISVDVQNGKANIGSASAGFSGGLIGVNQVKKEVLRISNELEKL